MNRGLRRPFLCALLGLGSLGVWAQQSDLSDAAGAPHVTASQSTSQQSMKTADVIPVCRVGDQSGPSLAGLVPPKALFVPKAALSEGERRSIIDQRIDPVSFLHLTVDEHGWPIDVCVMKELGHGLDRALFDTVAKYRFAPAMLDGKPVPVRVVVEVAFNPFQMLQP